MTQKLKILGPYKSDHTGPFCTRECVPVEVKIRDGRGEYPVAGYIGDSKRLDLWTVHGEVVANCLRQSRLDLMNAEEVPQPREFWVNEYSWGFGPLMASLQEARQGKDLCRYIRTIHVREVLPGEGE